MYGELTVVLNGGAMYGLCAKPITRDLFEHPGDEVAYAPEGRP